MRAAHVLALAVALTAGLPSTEAQAQSASEKLEALLAQMRCTTSTQLGCLAAYTINACASGCPRRGYAYRVDTSGRIDVHMTHDYLKKLRNAALSDPAYRSPATFGLPLSSLLYEQVQMLLRHWSARFVDSSLGRLSLAQVTTGSHTIDPARFHMVTWMQGGAAHAMGQTDMASWLVSVASWYAQLEQAREAGYYLALAEKAFRALAVRQAQGGVRNNKMGHRCYDGLYCYWFHSCPVCTSLADTVVLNQHLHAVRDALESHVMLARWRDGELPLARDPSQAAPLPAVLSPRFIDELREHGRGGLFQLAFAAGNQADGAAPPNLDELQLDAGAVGGRSYVFAAYRYRLGQGPAGIAAGNTCHYHYHSMDLLAGILQLIAGNPRFAVDPYFVELYYGLLYGRTRGDTRSCSNRSYIPPSRRVMAGVPLAELYLGSVVDLDFQDACDGKGGDKHDDAADWRNGAAGSPAPHGPRVFFDDAYVGCTF